MRQSCGLAVTGLAFLGCGFIFLILFGQSTTLYCSRPEPSQLFCERETLWLGRISIGREQVNGLTQAWVGESCDDSCTYRVELVTGEGTMGLTSYYSSGYRSKQEAADAINQFLAEPVAPELEVSSGAGWLGILLPAIFMALGLLMVMAWPASLLRFSAMAGRF